MHRLLRGREREDLRQLVFELEPLVLGLLPEQLAHLVVLRQQLPARLLLLELLAGHPRSEVVQCGGELLA